MLPVVVCGAGPVGMVLALELARWQVPVLVVERHARPSSFPRGRAISTRSMEIVRQLGMEQELTARGLPRTETTHFFAGRSLAAPDFGRISTGPVPQGNAGSVPQSSEVSPTATLGCPQDRFESLLRKRIAEHPLIDARFGTELLDAQQRADHVEIRLRTAAVPDPAVPDPAVPDPAVPDPAVPGLAGSGSAASDLVLRASWLVGADGSHSRVRRLADIGVDTFGASCRCVNILVDANLEPLLRDRLSLVYSISNPELHATVLTVDNQRRWLVNVVLPDGAQVDPTPQWCARMVRAAVGQDDLAFQVVSRQRWTATAWLARHYRRGRILIVGDAAHVCTPYGGFGMNLGLADAHNLAWKLALTSTGRAAADLIDSYEAERRPIGVATVTESAQRLATAREDHRSGRISRGEITGRPSDGLVLGGCYRSAAVHAAGEPPPPSVESYQPDAAPGCRAPHVRLPDGRSTLDLFGPWFTLLTGPRYRHPDGSSDGPSRGSSDGPSDGLPGGLPPDLVRRHRLDCSGAGPYRIGARGAVLVRPDGHVAWRATRDDEPPPRWRAAVPDRASRINH